MGPRSMFLNNVAIFDAERSHYSVFQHHNVGIDRVAGGQGYCVVRFGSTVAYKVLHGPTLLAPDSQVHAYM